MGCAGHVASAEPTTSAVSEPSLPILAPPPARDRSESSGQAFISGAFTSPVQEGAPVPSFQLVEGRGAKRVEQIVGKEAFVVVFFATWCELCATKIETVKRATSEVPGARILLVSVDDEATASHVPGFLRERRLEGASVIDGLDHPSFVASYNPTSALPLVAVVGRDGSLVGAQRGLWSGDGQRLEQLLHQATAP